MLIELRTGKILMIRKNYIGDLLELIFLIAQSTPGTLEESLGTIFLVFRAYRISMNIWRSLVTEKNIAKELGAQKLQSAPGTQLFQCPEHSMRFFGAH